MQQEFIRTKCFVFNVTEKERCDSMGIDFCDYEMVDFCFDKNAVEAFSPDDDGLTHIHLRSGSEFIVNIPFATFVLMMQTA